MISGSCADGCLTAEGLRKAEHTLNAFTTELGFTQTMLGETHEED